jgi:mannose-6-phosphate isomerase-like protein (cupin superfamily)
MTSSVDSEARSYQVEDFGPISSWSDLITESPVSGTLKGKGFIGKRLGLTGIEVSLNSLPPGGAYPFSHAHRKNEELYLFLTGSGEMLLDDRVVPVGPGHAVRISPRTQRCWRNTGSVPLCCVVIQAKAGSLEGATLADGYLAPAPPSWPR